MALRIPVLARKTHKWIALFVGVQVVIWSLSGLYMTVVHIDTIHGDHLVRQRPQQTVKASGLLDPLAFASSHQSSAVRLTFLDDRPIYVVGGDTGEKAFDARTGSPALPPTDADIRRLAATYYTGDEPIAAAQLLTEVPPEIRGRTPPIWRVEFDHWNKPTLYLSPVTGELLSRRHELWRIFDFVWMLHIMDYETRENVNNTLLRAFTVGAILMSLSGILMLVFAFPKKKKKGAGR